MKSVVLLSLLAWFPTAFAEITFEGYFRIEQNGRAIGYVIQRVEKADSGQQTVSTYIRRKRNDKETYTFTKSVAKKDFSPVSYYFRSDENAMDQYSKADFKGKKLAIETFNAQGKRIGRKNEITPEGSFPVAFLNYILLPSKMNLGKEYAYNAFSEANGRFMKGESTLKEMKSSGGQNVYQIFDDFTGEALEGFLFANGDPLGARSQSGEYVTYLVSSRAEAVQGFEDFPQRHVIGFFKDLPTGKKNPLMDSKGSLKPLDVINSFSSSLKQARAARLQDTLVSVTVPVKGL